MGSRFANESELKYVFYTHRRRNERRSHRENIYVLLMANDDPAQGGKTRCAYIAKKKKQQHAENLFYRACHREII